MGSLLPCNGALLVVALDTVLLRLSARVKTIPVAMVLDSGASHDLVSLDFVTKLGVTVALAPVQVRLANGSILTT